MLLKINNIEYKISKHALKRMKTRKVSEEDIEDALINFKSKRILKKEGHADRLGVMGRNDVTVIINEKYSIIITVYNYRKEYYKSRRKNRRNKTRKDLKRKHGNRVKH